MKFLLLFGITLFLVSCDEEEINVYSTRKQHKAVSFQKEAADSGIIAAVINLPSKQWYIKMAGSGVELTQELEHFKKVVKDITFDEDLNPVIKMGPGWKESKGNPMRYMTYKKANLEISVVSLPHSPLLDNINRWRSQLGLSAIDDERESMKDVEIIEVDGYRGAIVVILP